MLVKKITQNRWISYEICGVLMICIRLFSNSRFDHKFSDGANIKFGFAISDNFWHLYIGVREVVTQRWFKLFFEWYLSPEEKSLLDKDIKAMVESFR